MKRFITLLMVAFITGLANVPSHAQSSERENRTKDRTEELGERLGRSIENFIQRIGRELSLLDDEDAAASDTLRKRRASRSGHSTKVQRDENSVTYEGDTVIEEDDTLSSNIVVKAGDLTVYGVVDGDAMVVGGDLYVKDGGKIKGNVKVISGEVIKEEGGYIGGYIDRTSATTASYREDQKKFIRSSYRLHANWIEEVTNLDNFVFRYNRVEGLFLGLGSDKKYYWDGRREYSAYGSVGYGFRSHRWRYNLGLNRQFAFDDGSLFEFGVEGHSLTDTKDQWLIGLGENTAAALLIHEDFRDYFGREGLGVNVAYALQRDNVTARLKFEYLLDRYASLDNRTEWSLFGGDKVFRPNPAIDDGRMRSILSSVGVSTVSKTFRGPEGWSAYATVEVARRSFGSEFSFNQYITDIRRYQPLGRYDNFNMRVRIGSAEGRLPLQKIFELGGLGTLHAFPFKSEAGERMILVNAEYILNGDFLGDLTFWPSWLLRGINFIFLSDAGLTRTAARDVSWYEGFGGITFNEFRSDIGVGISNKSGSFRLAYVWRTDVSGPAKFIFRFARPF